MLVRFKKKWFAPSAVKKPNKLMSISGKRFKVGDHEIPDEYEDILPSTAKILRRDGPKREPWEEKEEAFEADPNVGLKTADIARAAAEEETGIHDEINKSVSSFQAALEAEEAAEELKRQERADTEAAASREEVSRDTKPAPGKRSKSKEK